MDRNCNLTIRLPSTLYRRVEQRALTQKNTVQSEIISLLGLALEQQLSETSPEARQLPGSENGDIPEPASGSPRA